MKQQKNPHKKHVRIGLLITSVEFGGLETVVKCLIDHHDHAAFDMMPLIFTANRQRERTLVSELQKEGKEYCNIIVDSERIKYMNPIMNLKQVYKLVRENQFDLIHTHGYRADVLGFMAARPLRVPLVATCHGFIPNDKKLMLYNSLDRFVLKHFDRVIAVSNGIRDSLLAAGVRRDNISVIPNAVGLNHDPNGIEELRRSKRSLMDWNDKHFVMGYVGRLSEEKGLGFLIDTVPDLIKSGIPVKLVLIGEGPRRKELELMSKNNGTDTTIMFLGFQNDISSWLPAFDVFVLPSLMEGTPMAMLEAMLCGLPVVASGVGGIPDVVKSGENGILVRPGRPQDIAKAISLLYRDKGLRHKMGIEARQTVQARYNLGEWIKKMEAEYRRVVAG
jgi:glycosyltransferase involved in cell wall biosynthesis